MKLPSPIRHLGKKTLESIYYNCMTTYEQQGMNPYSDLPVKFPVLEEYFLPHVMFPTEVDKARSRVGMHYMFLFFKTFVQTLQLYPHFFNDLSSIDVFWSEKRANEGINSRFLIVEHGWLPRSSYQVSPWGANGRGAPQEQEGGVSYVDIFGGIGRLRGILARLTDTCFGAIDLMGHSVLPKNFIVVPMQLGNDLNLRDSSTEFADIFGKECATSSFVSAFVRKINGYDLPCPVLFTQHPVDQQEHIVELRSCDRFYRSNSGLSTLSLIRHPGCKGVVSVNSNVIHEALCSNIPCCVLGRLFWREEQKSPFQTDPSRFFDGNVVMPHEDLSVLEYLAKLLCYQWYLTDLQNPCMIREMLVGSDSLVPFQIREKFSMV